MSGPHAHGAARALVDALRASLPGADADCIETHISWVLLAGGDAWKIKKPLKLDFLDFSTLEQRHAACLQELRINRRTAPGLYLDVVPITGSVRAPRIGGSGPVLEWAVHMRRFPADAELARIAAGGQLRAPHVDALARRVAALHADAARATPAHSYGQPEALVRAARDNFPPLAALLAGTPLAGDADALARWSAAEGERLMPLMRARLAAGQVRECHGDLHLGNVAVLEGRIVMFDALEFDEALRWTDTLSDAAFLAMDLHAHDRPDLAARFVDAWLSHSGDYSDLALLRYYEVYRALVRAKVAALRAQQESEQAGRQAASERCAALIGVAEALARPGAPVLVLLHGVSGSGKTWGAQHMLEATGAVRIRSDVERKRLRGMTAQEHSGSAPGRGLYAHTATEETYAHLAALARAILRAGYPVLVDATFLRASQRRMFMRLAREERVPLRIADFVAAHDVLRARVGARLAAGGDASEATLEVLERQLRTREPLSADERAIAMQFDTSAMSQARIGAQARALLHDVHT